jgi:hypothetical protein
VKRAERIDQRSRYDHEDFKKKGTRAKYLEAYRSGNNLVLLEPRVAAAFPTERAVNEALSSLIDVAEQKVRSTSRRRRAHKQQA